ncbi:hypothetical protein L4C33_13440 [Vibrio makurazakiensis]|uniref:hypothetical protein n=1 Tax=Vibrio makurazakiensis TaxID=2910250 RepID=UPI003D097021
MFTIEGTCDWCKQPKLVIKHDYIDGKYHHACKDCNDFAVIDVRQFNIGEMEMRAKLSQATMR